MAQLVGEGGHLLGGPTVSRFRRHSGGGGGVGGG